MRCKNILQHTILNLHKYSIFIVNIGWILSPIFLIIHILVILSWKINSNKCIVSEFEYKLFGRTFIGQGKKYFVPRKHRYFLYGNFIVGNIYYFIYKLIPFK